MDAGSWLTPAFVAAVALLTVAGAAVFHYEGLKLLDRRCFSGRQAPGRRAVAIGGMVIFGLHAVQVLMYGVVMWWVSQWPGGGQIDEGGAGGLLDALYLSALHYSTLGAGGDPSPTGPIRILITTESLSGLLTITWSASFVYDRLSRRFGQGGSGD